MPKKILLLTPPYHTGIIEITGKWPPLSLVYLAGHLRQAGFQVEIYDAMSKDHTLADIERYVASAKPDAVLIGAFTPSINAAVDTLKTVKKSHPEILTVLGGVHANFCYGELLQRNRCIDFIVRGEGEITVVELLLAINGHRELQNIPGIAYLHQGEVIATPERDFISDLDQLIPAWDLLEWNDYFYRVTERKLGLLGSSRGCPHKCRFCSQHLFWRGTYRERSPQSFVAEVAYLHSVYGVGMFMLADEYTTLNRQRWEEILDLLREKDFDVHFSMETRVEDILRDRDILWKYKAAGFIHVYVGVETVNQKTLDYYDKNLKVEQSGEAIRLLNDAGIISECSFILGNIDETAQSIDVTLDQALRMNPDFAHFLLITPWPYTELYKQLEGYIVESDLSKYHFVYPVVRPLGMGTDELWEKLINCFKVFYIQKMRQCLDTTDEFKKWYMLRSIQIMHHEFFISNFGQKAIELPREMGEEMEQLLRRNQGGKDKMNEKYDINSEFVRKLDEEIVAFIEAGVANKDEEQFNHLALKEFEFQFNANKIYREYCIKQDMTPDKTEHWSDIPAIPTSAFKQHVIASFPLQEAELALLTSGTTDPMMRGKIYRDKRSLDMILRSNYLLTKAYLFPDIDKIRILLMVPSPKVAPAMAMAFGLNQVKNEFGTPDSLYLITPNGFETDTLVEALRQAETTLEPVALLGATSAFVHFFNSCSQMGIKFKLPKGSRVCDGGGYQGTFGDCSREEYYAKVGEFLGVPRGYCINTLGMSESGTNYFDNTIHNTLIGKPEESSYKVGLPWTRTVAVGPRTGQRMPKGEVGLLRHYDLTNRATVLAVQTDNLGYETDDGFEIIGRAAGQLSGFGLEPSSVKDWILAGHREQANEHFEETGQPQHPGSAGGHPSHISVPYMKEHQCSTKVENTIHSHPCSTVADAMITKAQGHPCSTVADAMITKAQGHPCSTVADDIIIKAHSHPCSTVVDNMLKNAEKAVNE